jgi:hypothetical protein
MMNMMYFLIVVPGYWSTYYCARKICRHYPSFSIGTTIHNPQSIVENNNPPSTMVIFTLTPTNANEIPLNVVHLIVAEGVTEVPEQLCFRDDKGFESLETVVFSKSVAVIGSWAFKYCINLKSVVFPNDSQLRVIGYACL